MHYILQILMWKSKIPAQKTANLCNQFLIVYLSKKKTQFEKLGLLKKSYVYHAAILSIKKYPLPIISSQQLKILYGVGDLLSQELVIVIKNHYRQFQKECRLQGLGIEEEPEEQQFIEQPDFNNSNMSRSRTKAVSALQHCEPHEDVSEEQNSRSIKSEVVEREYRPRPNTQAAHVLVQIGRIGSGEFICEESLKQKLKSINQLNPVKKYNNIIGNLLKNNYIQKDEHDTGRLKLTERGVSEMEKLQNKNRIKTSQIKIQSLLTTFKEAKQQLLQGANAKQERCFKQVIKAHFEKHLILIIDSREVKDKQQQCFFENRLQEKHGIACMTANLPIGDFAWLYDGQILDYIVERKKADDLLSSILDGRYKEQKFRLKNSGFSNIFYLFEGHLKGANALSERSVQAALLKTRIKDEFKVISVATISESVRFLSFLTESIQARLRTEGEVTAIGTFEQLLLNSSKGSNITVKQIFGLSLKTIPGVGKNSVGEVLKYFSSFRQMHRQLSRLGGHSQRLEFLRELFKGSGVPKQLPGVLVDILFDCTKN